MPSFRRSLLFSCGDRYAAILVQLAITTVLARLLTPSDFGVFGVTLAVMALAEALREFGVGAFLIQAPTLEPARVRTAFTVGLALSLGMAAAVCAVAPAVAGFYGDRRLQTALSLTSLGFVLVAFTVPSVGLLRREMRFGRVALINLAGSLAQLATAMVLGLLGGGYLSLVLATVAGQLAAALAAAALGPGRWIYRPHLSGWREVVAFGGTASATNLLNTLYTMLPQIALGRFAGLDAAGLFNRATLLCQLQDRLVVGVMTPVLLPALARQARDRRDLRLAYLRGVDLGATVQWPFLASVFLLADPLVRIVLGPQWTEAAWTIRILCLGQACLFAAFLTFPTLVAVGQVRATLAASLISLPPSLLAVALAAAWGAHAAAAAVSACALAQMAVALRFVRAALGFTWSDLFGAMRPGLTATAGAAVPAAMTLLLDGTLAQVGVAAAACSALAALVGWLAALVLLGHPLAGELARGLRAARRLLPGPVIRPRQSLAD